MLECPKYKHLREGYYKELFFTLKIGADLIRDILNPTNLSTTKLVCKYIQEANISRNKASEQNK